MIPIFDTYLSTKAKNNVLDCLQSGWISSQGKYVLEFEKNLTKYFKMKYCLATSNCTTALHLSILSLDLKKNDEIICPAFVIYCTSKHEFFCLGPNWFWQT